MRALSAAVLALVCAGCIEAPGHFSPTPPPQRVEQASGTLTVSADEPMASVLVTAEIVAADAGTDVVRAAFFDIDAVLRPRATDDGTADPDEGARRVLVGLRWPDPSGRSGEIVWSKGFGDAPQRWEERPGMPVCSRGCANSVEVVVVLADPSAGPATIDWTAAMPVTYRVDPPPPDAAGIRADDPIVIPATAMSFLTSAADPVEIGPDRRLAARRVRLEVANAAGLRADQLGAAIVARVAPSGGAHRSVLIEVASAGRAWPPLSLSTVGREGAAGMPATWSCAADTCSGVLDLSFRRVEDASAGPTTVEWSVLGWALAEGVTWQVAVEADR